jgi:hypothetical protein
MFPLLPLKKIYNYSTEYIGGIVIALIYFVFFGWMLYTSNGMPYVTDNNETYSSIIHAKSISQFGISKTYGLADEVFSPSSMAHPFVHSHQGNYPRLFAWVIYELGATNPMQQILITTFTVGLAALLLAFIFISRIANPWFALIFCLVLISDYVFFSQWQIVTYRVWYTFVFFLQFFAIEQYLKKKNVRWAFLIVINTALFCYGELIFGAFLGLFSFFWLTLHGWRDKKLFFGGVFCLITGLLISIFTLVAQGIGYFGFDSFLRDVQLTFLARNDFDSGAITMAEISKFYKEHNVVFWENLLSRDQFMGFKPFIRSIFSSFVLVYGPLISIFFGILFLSYVINLGFPKIYQSIADKLIRFQIRSANFIVVGQYFFTSLAIASLMWVGFVNASYYYGFLFSPWWLPILAIEIVLISWTIISLGKYSTFHFNLMVLLAVTASNLLPHLISNAYAPYWIDIHGIQIIKYLLVLLPLFFVISTFSSSKVRASSNFNSGQVEILPLIPNVFRFIFAGLLAYSIVYFLSPGYVFSGYVTRYAPFLVFIFDLLIAIAFYQLINFVYTSLLKKTSTTFQMLKAPFIFLAIALFYLMLSLWLGLQYSLLNKLPPTHLSILEKLSSYPYRDSSFVVNTYAAPVAVQTGQWAYMDPNIGKALLIKVKGEKRLLGDQRYLWFADKNSNDEYRRPDYFICLLGQDVSSILRTLTDKANYRGCLDFPLVNLALNSQYSNQELRVVEYDKLGEQQTGVASWAIVKFDWGGRLGNGLEWVEQSTVELSK